MYVARSKLDGKAIAIAGKGNDGMEVILAKMTVVLAAFLLSMGRVFGGVHIQLSSRAPAIGAMRLCLWSSSRIRRKPVSDKSFAP